jgi:hypothetical protein
LVTPVDKIRACPSCQRIFYRTGRRTHCSRTCYNKAHWSSLPAETVERYREVQYEKNGWIRRNRKKVGKASARKK